MKEIKLNVENLSEEDREQLMKLVEKANNKQVTYKPSFGTIYWYISSEGALYHSEWDEHFMDKMRYGIGNCFKTKEEAAFALEKQKVVAELKRFAEEHNKEKRDFGFCIIYDNLSNKVAVHFVESSFFNYGMAFFESAKVADLAIKQIGKERLKKYYFEVEE